MGAKVREFVESCLPCQAAQARTETELLKPTEFPEGPEVTEEGAQEGQRLDESTDSDYRLRCL